MPDPAPIEPDPRPQISLVSSGSAEPYRRLAEIFHDVLSEQSLGALLERIADALAELIPYEDVHIYEADETKRELSAVLARGDWADEVMSETLLVRRGNHRAGPSTTARRSSRIRRISTHACASCPGTPIEPEALIAVPLIARGQLKGTLNIYRVGEEAAFTDEEFLLAKRFGDAAALAIDNAHIRARLEHQAETDALTGLYNHRSFHDRLRQELLRASAAHETVARRDDRPRRLQEGERRLRPRDRRPPPAAGRRRAPGVRARDRRRLPRRRRGVRGDPSRRGHRAARPRSPSASGQSSRTLEAEAVGKLTVSTGIAIGPENAANPRELVACAEAAMMTAKTRGKGLVVPFDESARERPAEEQVRRDDVRSIAHLKMLQSLSGKLSRLNDVAADRRSRSPTSSGCSSTTTTAASSCATRTISFPSRSAATCSTAEPGDPVNLLPTQVGRGITGRVAETGEPAPRRRRGEATSSASRSPARPRSRSRCSPSR